jgi:hypothetical protein
VIRIQRRHDVRRVYRPPSPRKLVLRPITSSKSLQPTPLILSTPPQNFTIQTNANRIPSSLSWAPLAHLSSQRLSAILPTMTSYYRSSDYLPSRTAMQS